MSQTAYFFEQFDDGTLTKLELFRLYVTEWFSTFAVNRDRNLKRISIYDFFSGTGGDNDEHPGSPLLICDAIQAFLRTCNSGMNENLEIVVNCSDVSKQNIEKLKNRISQKNYDGFKVIVKCLDFETAFNENRKNLNSNTEASLVILDQFGVKEVTFEFIDKVFDVIRQTPFHTYQILTKREIKLAEYFAKRDCPCNVWLGVTVEDKKSGIPRINYLRNIDASVRFISAEPLLEDLGKLDLTGIHWVIVGGESGNQARPMNPHWVRCIKEQCEYANVAFFFKQWGTWGADGKKRNKYLNGKKLDGEIYQDYPILEKYNLSV